MSNVVFRLANASDAHEILDIYAHYIKNTAVTFETRVPTDAEYAARIISITKEFPFLVWTVDARITGYAYAHRFHERDAYGWNAELSVYTEISNTAKGMGSALYRALIEILRLQNFQNLYGIIGIPNDASVALHAKFGFETIGRYHATGYKLGKWHDVVIMEKALGDKSCPPRAVIPVTGIPIEKISQILVEEENMYLQKNIGE